MIIGSQKRAGIFYRLRVLQSHSPCRGQNQRPPNESRDVPYTSIRNQFAEYSINKWIFAFQYNTSKHESHPAWCGMPTGEEILKKPELHQVKYVNFKL